MAFVHRYAAPARWLHWIIAVLVLGALGAGFYLGYGDPPDGPATDRLYNLHESTGVVILALAILRLVVRWANPPPPLPAGTPAIIRAMATLNHAALYLLLLAQPVVGYLGNNAGGYALAWYNLVNLPALVGKNDALSNLMFSFHKWGGIALVVLIGLHLLGVVYHAVIRRDGLLQRMV